MKKLTIFFKWFKQEVLFKSNTWNIYDNTYLKIKTEEWDDFGIEEKKSASVHEIKNKEDILKSRLHIAESIYVNKVYYPKLLSILLRSFAIIYLLILQKQNNEENAWVMILGVLLLLILQLIFRNKYLIPKTQSIYEITKDKSLIARNFNKKKVKRSAVLQFFFYLSVLFIIYLFIGVMNMRDIKETIESHDVRFGITNTERGPIISYWAYLDDSDNIQYTKEFPSLPEPYFPWFIPSDRIFPIYLSAYKSKTFTNDSLVDFELYTITPFRAKKEDISGVHWGMLKDINEKMSDSLYNTLTSNLKKLCMISEYLFDDSDYKDGRFIFGPDYTENRFRDFQVFGALPQWLTLIIMLLVMWWLSMIQMVILFVSPFGFLGHKLPSTTSTSWSKIIRNAVIIITLAFLFWQIVIV